LQLDRWAPSQFFLGLIGVEADAKNLTRLWRTMNWITRITDESPHLLEKVIDGSSFPGPEVVNLTASLLHREVVSPHTILHIHKVPLLMTASVDRDLLPHKHLKAEYGYHTGFTKWVLPRAIHIGIAEDRVIEPVVLAIKVQIELHRIFAGSIGREGTYGVALIAGEMLRFPVYCSTAGGINDFPDPISSATLE